MELIDAEGFPIKPTVYEETFYKGEDDFRNRIVVVYKHEGNLCIKLRPENRFYPLNHYYSRWLTPVTETFPLTDSCIRIAD